MANASSSVFDTEDKDRGSYSYSMNHSEPMEYNGYSFDSDDIQLTDGEDKENDQTEKPMYVKLLKMENDVRKLLLKIRECRKNAQIKRNTADDLSKKSEELLDTSIREVAILSENFTKSFRVPSTSKAKRLTSKNREPERHESEDLFEVAKDVARDSESSRAALANLKAKQKWQASSESDWEAEDLKTRSKRPKDRNWKRQTRSSKWDSSSEDEIAVKPLRKTKFVRDTSIKSGSHVNQEVGNDMEAPLPESIDYIPETDCEVLNYGDNGFPEGDENEYENCGSMIEFGLKTEISSPNSQSTILYDRRPSRESLFDTQEDVIIDNKLNGKDETERDASCRNASDDVSLIKREIDSPSLKPTEPPNEYSEDVLIPKGEDVKDSDGSDVDNDTYDTDMEIEKLVNFATLMHKRKRVESTNVKKSTHSRKPAKKQKKDELLDILGKPNETEESQSGSESDADSDSASENIQLTESQIQKSLNENAKKALCHYTSSESETEAVDSNDLDGKKVDMGIEQFLRNDVNNNSFNDKESEKSDQHSDASSKESVVGRKTRVKRNTIKDSDDSDDNDDSDDSEEDEQESSSNSDTSIFSTKKSKAKRGKPLSKTSNRSPRSKPSTSKDEDYITLSSDSDCETTDKVTTSEADGEEQTTRKIRRLLEPHELAEETKRAQKEEEERSKRVEEKKSWLDEIIASQMFESQQIEDDESVKEVILDYDSKKGKNIVVHKDIVKHLKPHQIDGIEFMYDCCYGSVDTLKKLSGSGCILAHCMGLGKTLQLIALLHTVISYPQLETDKVLVLCPKSTVMNWKGEIKRWLRPIRYGRKLEVFHFADNSNMKQKINILEKWHNSSKNTSAGCLLIGYEAFRTLVSYGTPKTPKRGKRCVEQPEKVEKKSKLSDEEIKRTMADIAKYLLIPGADLVICDEGHVIKNQKTTTSWTVNKIRTKRRIILTGTPIQNNLKEYYSMVDFIKPGFLGTAKEFGNLYANPIKNGQHKDSSSGDIREMKERSFLLHKILSKFVQRREASLLKTFLEDKYEYVLFVPLTDVQTRLYEHFLRENPLTKKNGGKNLLPDYTALRKIWTHPKVLEAAWKNALEQNKKNVQAKPIQRQNQDSEEDIPDDVLDIGAGHMSITSNWWSSFVTKEDLETVLPSSKLILLFEILKKCEENGEKCLIFSSFVMVLDVVEFFMRQIDKQTKSGEKHPGLESFRGSWKLGQDYYRLDGSTPKTLRQEFIENFNNPSKNPRVFLISAKAGGQGINLTGANRVVLLDTSWNPSSDQQNIYRVFRLGQKKVCYIYRLLAMGTMEEKVYSRSVTKQAMSFRVVDEQQIYRHYNMADLAELYTLTKPDMLDRPVPNRPADDLLAHLLHNYPNMVYKFHEHDSLLERETDEELSEEEKAAAWAAYQNGEKARESMNNAQRAANRLEGMEAAGMMYPNGPGTSSSSMIHPSVAGFGADQLATLNLEDMVQQVTAPYYLNDNDPSSAVGPIHHDLYLAPLRSIPNINWQSVSGGIQGTASGGQPANRKRANPQQQPPIFWDVPELD